MFFHILKKDMKRKKTMNVIVLLFIILSSMFASSSVNNIVTVLGGVEYFMDKSGIADVDYFYLTAEKGSGDTLTAKLEAEPSVTGFTKETVIFNYAANITLDGEKVMEYSNSSMIQRVGEADVKYFDKDNKVIESVPEGCVYITGGQPVNSGLKEGDMLDIQDMIRDTLLAAQPLSNICKPDCKGLCPVCGQNLNEGDCGCDRFVPDPRMAALQQLLKKD